MGLRESLICRAGKAGEKERTGMTAGEEPPDRIGFRKNKRDGKEDERTE